MADVAVVGGVPIHVLSDAEEGADGANSPDPSFPVGYYPVPGWPAGTVQAWDGESWRGAVTVPGFYLQADGNLEWWNGHCWVAGVPVPRALAVVPAPAPPRPTMQPRTKRAHARRRRTHPWYAATAALATITALGASGRR